MEIDFPVAIIPISVHIRIVIIPAQSLQQMQSINPVEAVDIFTNILNQYALSMVNGSLCYLSKVGYMFT